MQNKGYFNLLSLAFLLFTCQMTFAQHALGLKGGAQFNTIQATENLKNLLPAIDHVNGFSVGLVSEFRITPQFAIQPELLYNRKGFSIDQQFDVPLFGVDVPIGAKAITRMDYLEVPLLAKYKFGNEGISAYLTAGPTFGYAVRGDLVTTANFILDFDIATTPINLGANNFQRFEVGAAVGGGLTLNTGTSQFFVDARYNHGFTQVYDLPVVDEKLRNRGVSLTAGFMVPLGK